MNTPSEAFEALEDLLTEESHKLIQMQEDYSWYALEVEEQKALLKGILYARNYLAELEGVETIDMDRLEERASEEWAGA